MSAGDQDYGSGMRVGRIEYDPSYGQRTPVDISVGDLPGFKEWQARLLARQVAPADVDRLLRIMRALVNVPAIVEAVNPSGKRHEGNCECPYCLALCEVYGKPERPTSLNGADDGK